MGAGVVQSAPSECLSSELAAGRDGHLNQASWRSHPTPSDLKRRGAECCAGSRGTR